MTEYDYSPDAIERYLDKQANIASWVDNTRRHEATNPFEPIPGEHAPSETYYQPSPQQPLQSQFQQYLPQQYPYQLQQQQQPYPAFYATPQGVISPTYVGSSKRHHHKHHHSSSHHNSGSKSLRPSPHTAYAALPMGVGLTYAPTPQRSVSTPPAMPMQSYFGYQPLQQQVYPASSSSMVSPPAMQMQVQGFPFPPQQVTSPPVLAPAYSHSTSHSHSRSYPSRPSSSSHTRRSRSHSRDSYSRSKAHHGTGSYAVQSPPLSYGTQSMGSYGTQVVTSPSNQPMVVPIAGGRGYVVVPAGQSAIIAGAGAPASYFPSTEYLQHRDVHGGVIYSDSDSDSDPGHRHGHVHAGGGSFFGKIGFKKLGTSLIGHKTNSKRRGRRGSH